MDMPDKIWAGRRGEWWTGDFGYGDTEYIRADLIPAMLAAEREKALREAAQDQKDKAAELYNRAAIGDSIKARPMINSAEKREHVAMETLALIQKGGDAL